PYHDPIIAHITTAHDLPRLAKDIPDAAYKLAQMFWAGPLTMVLTRADHVPAVLSAQMPTVAVRMPSHPVARALIKAAGTPIAAPSANTFTRPSSTKAEHVLEDLSGHVDLILDGGETHIGIESTVIDMTQDVPVVLRPGGVLLKDLRRVIPEVKMVTRFNEMTDETPSPSPGIMLKHYSPRADVMLFDGERSAVLNKMRDTAQQIIAENKRVGILTTAEEGTFFTETGARIISLGSRDDLEQIAQVLFGAMRALDKQKCDKIMVRAYSKQGIGEAIWDRLLRAAEGEVIEV
ncbi:MAG: L-threonylcarbamoyladenylate synthase, partial [Chloroflexota bacterium]